MSFNFHGFFGSIKCSVIITVLFLIFTGPGVLLWLCFAIPFHYYSMSRGRLAVRAFVYLGLLSRGDRPERANEKALSVDFHAASEMAPHALEFVNEFYGGKQLPMISNARINGFKG